ncbi:DUF6503 family protein [Tenacibaculum maritimum]|uniref:DUF6503 family protein n=1 Tax=Tenacibaculum maritimum TaxID=107401 RepID=UPI0038762C49
MKKITVFIIVAMIGFASCAKKEKATAKKEQQATEANVYKGYPEALVKVFKKHGGLATWKQKKVLSFRKGDEEHTTDLYSRKALIAGTDYTIGFDGKKPWVQQKDTASFKGNADFYYNLYFYFYAMPFILADDGIVYEEAAPITFEGVSYPGIKISYNSGVGVSPEDNYYLYYNPKTYQMEWLGYTVTFFSKKASNTVKLIKYGAWTEVDGVLLPKSMTWYKRDENGAPLEPAKEPTVFEEITLSKTALTDDFYKKR